MITVFSKLTGFSLTVASIATLSAWDAGHLEDGAQGLVTSQLSPWTLVKNARAGTVADGATIVAATGAGANAFWVRQISTERYWAYQTQWYVDPSAGNDENNGATTLTALKTIAELTRRLQVILQGTNYTIDLLGNIPSTDRLNWTPIFVGPATGTGFNQRGTINFRGQMTVSRSGTLSTATQTSTSAQASATDPGVADWTADIGRMIVVTSGAQSGESAWVAANLGANVARVASWTNVAGTAIGTVPANNSTYNIVTLTTWSCEAAVNCGTDSCSITFENIESLSPVAGTYAMIFSGASFRPIRWKSNQAASTSPPIVTNACLFRSSCFTQVNATANAPGLIQLSSTSTWAGVAGCFFLNMQVEGLAGSKFRFADTLYQGTRLQFANSGQNTVQSGYAVLLGNSGFFDWDRNAAANGRDAAISVEGNGFVGVTGFVFGTSAVANTYGVRVEAGGVLAIASQGAVAGISVAGAAAAIRFDDPGAAAAVGTAIPPLVAGGAVPAVAALTTWGQFAAAPFNSYVMSYRNGARIFING